MDVNGNENDPYSHGEILSRISCCRSIALDQSCISSYSGRLVHTDRHNILKDGCKNILSDIQSIANGVFRFLIFFPKRLISSFVELFFL